MTTATVPRLVVARVTMAGLAVTKLTIFGLC